METPRTNKNAGYYCGHGIKKNSDLVIDPNGPFVLADFARELERENHALRDGYLHLLGQVEQAREGFGIYHNSPTMEEAVKTARMILLPNAAMSHERSELAP